MPLQMRKPPKRLPLLLFHLTILMRLPKKKFSGKSGSRKTKSFMETLNLLKSKVLLVE
jgi:hypothetical protein